jgi:hypothetical protein
LPIRVNIPQELQKKRFHLGNHFRAKSCLFVLGRLIVDIELG